MKRLFTLLAVISITFSSCEKEEKIEGPNYNNQVVKADLGYVEADDEYNAQYFLRLDDIEESMSYAKSSNDYVNFYVVKNPDNTETPVTTAPGDWTVSLTEYKVDLNMGSWYNGYELVGMLINTEANVMVSRMYDDAGTPDDDADYIDFEDFTLADASGLDYSSDVDAIGYGWKSTNPSTGLTTIRENNYYVIKVSETEVYKFKFIDYYSGSKKGNVEMEFKLLQ